MGTFGNWFFWCLGLDCLVVASLIFMLKPCVKDGLGLAKLEYESPSRMYFGIAPVIAGIMLSISAPKALLDDELVGLKVMYSILLIL